MNNRLFSQRIPRGALTLCLAANAMLALAGEIELRYADGEPSPARLRTLSEVLGSEKPQLRSNGVVRVRGVEVEAALRTAREMPDLIWAEPVANSNPSIRAQYHPRLVKVRFASAAASALDARDLCITGQ